LFHRDFPDAEFVPVQYGQEPPDVTGKDVVIVDFSYRREVLLAMKAVAKSMIVLDHHKTAQQELAGLDFCTFDMNKSGGRLAWEWLCKQPCSQDEIDAWVARWGKWQARGLSIKNAPWLVDYTEDRDLWRWQLPDSREITTGLRSYPLDFAMWDNLDAADELALKILTAEGKAILRSEAVEIANHVRRAVTVTIAGHAVPAVNATVLFSDIAGTLAMDAPFGVAWFVRDDGKVQFSLRSRNGGVDVSEIAKSFGGGGHAAAAGFELPMPKAMNLLFTAENAV